MTDLKAALDVRDLRNRSRDWESTPTQAFLDCRLNVFGLELFVESYWNMTERSLRDPKEDSMFSASAPVTFFYRGMKVTLDPSPGLEALKKELNNA